MPIHSLQMPTCRLDADKHDVQVPSRKAFGKFACLLCHVRNILLLRAALAAFLVVRRRRRSAHFKSLRPSPSTPATPPPGSPRSPALDRGLSRELPSPRQAATPSAQVTPRLLPHPGSSHG